MSGSPQDMESNHAMECKFQANKALSLKGSRIETNVVC
jgi:hypothetical protein